MTEQAHKAYEIYSNALIATGTTNQYIKDLYNRLIIQITANANLEAQLVKANMDIKRLEEGLMVPGCPIKKKAN